MFSNPRLHTYTWEDRQTQILDPEGLASMDMETQDLVTQIKGVLNFSRGCDNPDS